MRSPQRFCLPGSTAAFAALLFALCPPAATQNTPAEKLDSTKTSPITRPQIVSIAYNTYFINEFGIDSQYLLIGANRALLIDTGTGFYDIKGTVESLTSLPYEVAITHGHGDHAGMIGAFDAVYIYKADTASDRPQKVGDRPQKEAREKLSGDSPRGCRSLWGDAKLRQFNNQPAIKPLYDGQTFDLGGGRVVTVYHIPGHTLDSCVFLDRKTRILFSGDVANSQVDIHGTPEVSASTRLRGWIKLQNLGAEFDRIFHGHTALGCEVDVKPLDPDILGDLIEVYRQVLRGDAKLDKIGGTVFTPGRASTKAVWKKVQVDFDPNYLWETGEPHIVP